jgi:hypothetical protein
VLVILLYFVSQLVLEVWKKQDRSLMMMNVWFRFLLVCIAAAASVEAKATKAKLALAPGDNSKYLYRGDPEASVIQEYTKQENHFMTSTQPRVVKFYSPFCVSKNNPVSMYLSSRFVPSLFLLCMYVL